MSQRDASIVAIFLEYENPPSLFLFRATVFSPKMTRVFNRENIKLHEMKKKLGGFSYSKKITNFEAFLRGIKLSINLLFLKPVQVCTLQETRYSWFFKFENDLLFSINNNDNMICYN